MLATALIHMLLPAAAALQSPCLPASWTERYEAWAYLFVMLAVLLMHLFDYLIKVGWGSRAAAEVLPERGKCSTSTSGGCTPCCAVLCCAALCCDVLTPVQIPPSPPPHTHTTTTTLLEQGYYARRYADPATGPAHAHSHSHTCGAALVGAMLTADLQSPHKAAAASKAPHAEAAAEGGAESPNDEEGEQVWGTGAAAAALGQLPLPLPLPLPLSAQLLLPLLLPRRPIGERTEGASMHPPTHPPTVLLAPPCRGASPMRGDGCNMQFSAQPSDCSAHRRRLPHARRRLQHPAQAAPEGVAGGGGLPGRGWHHLPLW